VPAPAAVRVAPPLIDDATTKQVPSWPREGSVPVHPTFREPTFVRVLSFAKRPAGIVVIAAIVAATIAVLIAKL
jgi:hypothetical protein